MLTSFCLDRDDLEAHDAREEGCGFVAVSFASVAALESVARGVVAP